MASEHVVLCPNSTRRLRPDFLGDLVAGADKSGRARLHTLSTWVWVPEIVTFKIRRNRYSRYSEMACKSQLRLSRKIQPLEWVVISRPILTERDSFYCKSTADSVSKIDAKIRLMSPFVGTRRRLCKRLCIWRRGDCVGVMTMTPFAECHYVNCRRQHMLSCSLVLSQVISLIQYNAASSQKHSIGQASSVKCPYAWILSGPLS